MSETNKDFPISVKKFQDLTDNRKFSELVELGGLEYIAKALKVDPTVGLGDEEDEVEVDGEMQKVPYGRRKQM